MTEGSLLYEFLNLTGENETDGRIGTLRQDAIVSMRHLKIAGSSTYDTPGENDPYVLRTFEFSQECWTYAKFCEERLRGPLEECLRRHGFALKDNGLEGIYLSRLESLSVLWPTKDNIYANVLAPMFNSVYETKIQSKVDKEDIKWNPKTAIYFHNAGIMVPEGQLHYLHYLYSIRPIDFVLLETGQGWANVTFQL